MSSLYKGIAPLIIVIFSVLLSYILLKKLAEPFVWLAIIWVVTLATLIRVIKYSLLKKLFLSLIIIVFILGMIEFYYELTFTHEPTLARGDILEDYSEFNDILGYSPKKDAVIPVAKYYGEELVYKATYNMDKNGLRVGPEISKNKAEKCIVFFGGSFTFGRGVEDYEALPYLVTEESGGKFRAINLAFSGYGPHQMLAMLENGLEQDLIDCEPDIGIYQGIVHHVARVNGHVNWDVHGPRYVMSSEGEVYQDGHYDDVRIENRTVATRVKKRFHNYLTKSKFYSEVYRNVVAARSLNSFVNLYLGVVDKSKAIFESRYPNSEFYVIFWDDPDYFKKYTNRILDGFHERGIKVFIVSEMLPGYHEDKTQYELSPHDSHPNPRAYKILSEYTLQNIIN